MVWPRALLACAVLALILICASANIPKPTPDAHGRIPFDVYFDTSAPLGLRFDSSLIVVGFSMIDNKPSPAETARWIAPGDTLVAVNGVDVTGIGLQRAVLAIRDAALPKVCPTFPSIYVTNVHIHTMYSVMWAWNGWCAGKFW